MDNRISELICTRLSHDIVGNVGAVANAVELLEEGDMDFLDDIKSILKTSSGVLPARLKFFRMAFGLGNTNIPDTENLKSVISSYLATVGGKTPPYADFATINPCHARAIMLLVMSVADILIRGGKISINSNSTQTFVSVDADARIASDKFSQMMNALQNGAAEVGADMAPILYLQEVCRHQGLKLSCSTNPCLCFILE